MLDKRQVKMIKKLLKQGLNKTEIARRLCISRETVRKYANLPDGYIPTINRTPVENLVDPFLPHIAKMLEVAKEENSFIPTTVIYEELTDDEYLTLVRYIKITPFDSTRELSCFEY